MSCVPKKSPKNKNPYFSHVYISSSFFDEELPVVKLKILEISWFLTRSKDFMVSRADPNTFSSLEYPPRWKLLAQLIKWLFGVCMVHLRGAQVLGTPKKSPGYGRARVEVTIATRIHQGTLLASARPHCRGNVPARVGVGLRLDVSPVWQLGGSWRVCMVQDSCLVIKEVV